MEIIAAIAVSVVVSTAIAICLIKKALKEIEHAMDCIWDSLDEIIKTIKTIIEKIS